MNITYRQEGDYQLPNLILDPQPEGVTEDLKRRDQMAWVGAMNNIRNRADEIVRAELIEV
ncbi:MAG: TnpV protein [Clostridia bacterium]|nr:TnpV protein [Clostridia bacterium]